MNCPYCNNDEISFKSIFVQSANAYGKSAVCSNCGLSSPAIVTGNDNEDKRIALELFSTIRISQPMMQVKYASSKPRVSIWNALYILFTVAVVATTLVLLVQAVSK